MVAGCPPHTTTIGTLPATKTTPAADVRGTTMAAYPSAPNYSLQYELQGKYAAQHFR